MITGKADILEGGLEDLIPVVDMEGALEEAMEVAMEDMEVTPSRFCTPSSI